MSLYRNHNEEFVFSSYFCLISWHASPWFLSFIYWVMVFLNLLSLIVILYKNPLSYFFSIFFVKSRGTRNSKAIKLVTMTLISFIFFFFLFLIFFNHLIIFCKAYFEKVSKFKSLLVKI